MQKHISYEKLSKKEKRRLDQSRRTTWGEIKPVTRKPQNSRAYNRKKAHRLERERWSVCFSIIYRYCAMSSNARDFSCSGAGIASSAG